MGVATVWENLLLAEELPCSNQRPPPRAQGSASGCLEGRGEVRGGRVIDSGRVR